ncbi:hypothetical protein B0I08_107143 [Glaciihabitans tibetensis]|uniref:DUF1269 domain-containing protein n=1 Tax=Glaciihabitans tibetensis TaxID=1266600 RepID=A0A2T0VB18_9MICO|nr:DUF6325 family protein [Glaciihabitans tibetensis]PRY67247.1 hypothetical protein B0I08_107143 [Glaciihabitans tibetensis]
MPLAPIEILTLAFPGNKFNGRILPELAKLVETDTITIIDGLFVGVDADGTVVFTEFDELKSDTDASAITELVERFDELISSEDVAEIAAALEPNSSAAILVFEHSWMTPLRDALVGSGGVLVDSVRIPGQVVEEVLAAVAELDELEQEEQTLQEQKAE